MKSQVFASALAALAFLNVASATPHAGDLTLQKRHLGRRGPGTRFSYFDPGLGACGKYNTNSDFIVALNTPQWDGGSHCFETITINYRGKTAQAQIVDRCVECPPDALDFSRGLFDHFANQGEGYLWGGSWNFGGAAPPKPKPETTSQKPKPTPTPKPEPTSTKEVPTTTSTKTKTSSRAPSTTNSSTVTNSTATSAPTGMAAGIPTDSVLYQFNVALRNLAGVAVAAAQE